MKCKTLIDPSREEEVLIYAHSRTARVEEIERFVGGVGVSLYGQDGSGLVRLEVGAVDRFVTEAGRVMAVVGGRRYRMRERLFELEAMLPDGFVRINQSSIARIGAMTRFDVTIGGSLRVSFRNGEWDYISRRQLKSVKERLGLK